MHRTLSALLVLAFVVAPAALAQGGTPAVIIRTEKVTDSVYCIFGPRAGNMGALIGPDGVILIDDQYAPYTKRILAEVEKLCDQPVRFLINTHWHFDHTGGNENMGKAGVALVAHRNVYTRMSTEQLIEAFGSKTPPSPAAALPEITFTDRATFHWNSDEVEITHMPKAHTDGDCVIHFKKNDVIHAGDVYFNHMFPFIDASSGGSLDGVIAAQKKVAAMAGETTRIIPGHGAVSGVAGLRAATAMLEDVRGKMRALIAEGKTLDEIVAAAPAGAYEDWKSVFMDARKFTWMMHWLMTGSDEGMKRFAAAMKAGK